jgi:hypothetical protein
LRDQAISVVSGVPRFLIVPADKRACIREVLGRIWSKGKQEERHIQRYCISISWSSITGSTLSYLLTSTLAYMYAIALAPLQARLLFLSMHPHSVQQVSSAVRSAAVERLVLRSVYYSVEAPRPRLE